MSQDPKKLLVPRYEAAKAQTPGNPDFWAAMLDQSDNFAYQTASAGKGGPFGAQLWLYNGWTDEYLLVGTPDHREDSNAVVSKGLASAHAEAENLSPENRRKVIDFLEENRGKGWHIVQVSSGESCQSCRSKQVLFAEELKQRSLIDADGFHVVFKATYGQTKRDADFNDAPYDMTFRVIDHLQLIEKEEGLFTLEEEIAKSPFLQDLVKGGELIYNPVALAETQSLPSDIQKIFDDAGDQPCAVIVSADGIILSVGLDTRDLWNDRMNLPENTAIIAALHKAAQRLRAEGVFESWNLEGARLVTNIHDIGPQAYAETLWYNLSGIDVIGGEPSVTVELLAQEVPGLSNHDLFLKAAKPYNVAGASMSVEFRGDENEASIAHLYWAARIKREALLSRQAERLVGLEGIKAGFLGAATRMDIERIVESSNSSSHYNGKQADSGLTCKL